MKPGHFVWFGIRFYITLKINTITFFDVVWIKSRSHLKRYNWRVCKKWKHEIWGCINMVQNLGIYFLLQIHTTKAYHSINVEGIPTLFKDFASVCK